MQQMAPTISVQHHNNYKATAARSLIAKLAFQLTVAHIYNSEGTKQNLDSLLEDNPEQWADSLSNE